PRPRDDEARRARAQGRAQAAHRRGVAPRAARPAVPLAAVRLLVDRRRQRPDDRRADREAPARRRGRRRGLGLTLTPRVDSALLRVGSLPADSSESALRQGAELFGDLVFALPDGETGPRAAWVGYERERLMKPNPAFELVEATASPTGIPRHAYET